MVAVFMGALVGLAAFVSADTSDQIAARVDDFEIDGITREGVTREDFEIFLALLNQTNLQQSLLNESLTLFVPTDDAFIASGAALGEGLLSKEYVVPMLLKDIESRGLDPAETFSTLLLYHAVEGRLTAAEVLTMRELKTLLPGEVIERGGQDMEAAQLGDAATSVRDPRIIVTDYEELNVIAHAIDRVLIPEALAIGLELLVDEGAGVKPVASGRGCKDCDYDELCTATPWKKTAAMCLPAPPMCYLSGDRNKGSENAEFVPYAPCCSGQESVPARVLGTGSWCLP